MVKMLEERYPLKNKTRIVLLLLLPLPVLFGSIFVGPSDAAPAGQVFFWLLAKMGLISGREVAESNVIHTIVADIRIPRILLTFMVGVSLSASGTALQAIFRNPLVSSHILGLQSGAAFGAALALVTPWLPVQFSAFCFGLLAVIVSYFLASNKGRVSSVTLILSGIIVTGIFTALLTIVQVFTDPFKLQTIVHWTMGNLHTASWEKLHDSITLMTIGTFGLLLFRWRMNVLALGDDETRAVGLHPEREKAFLLLFSTLAASAAVSVAGVVGMVGLIVPHMVRMLIGADNMYNVPVCCTFGGAFLVIVDNISRAAASFEIPIGIFTTLVSGPFFILLLKRTKIGWEL